MSRQERFIKNKQTIVLSILLITSIVSSGVFGILYIVNLKSYNDLNDEYGDLTNEYGDLNNEVNNLTNYYDNLTNEYDNLTNEYDDLTNEYDDLLTNYQILTGDYNTIFNSYQELQNTYNYITSTISKSIFPIQYSIFAEAVRRYYLSIYLGGETGKIYWEAFAKFTRDIILHDSNQHNLFNEVSNAFSDALKYGNDTRYLAQYIMSQTFYNWLPNWNGVGLTGEELIDIDTIIDWCINEIDYEYDSEITVGQESFDWDYIKFPVETAFRTMGDCEDQAILSAAYLESCGFETAIAVFHDSDHPTLGDFYHGVPIVHIEDTTAYNSMYPSHPLWSFGSIDPYYPDYTWCFLDPTWDIPFGTEPLWLTDYGGSLSSSFCSIAICDIDGSVG